MAIICRLELESGIVAENAYARIEFLSGGNKTDVVITLSYYLNEAMRVSGKSNIAQVNYSFVPSMEDTAPNFIKQGYEYLKTLHEFSSAEDA